jgi:hypothetical protein
MGHFTINLPDGKLGDVLYGTVRRKSSIFSLFSKNKEKNESKTGYVVRFGNNKANQEEYRLYKSKEGNWSQDVEGQNELDNDLHLSIRNAINEKELSGQ